MLYAVIIAGGRSRRFWPVTRYNISKCVVSLIEKKTLLQETIQSVKSIVPLRNIFVVTNPGQAKLIKKKLRGLNKNNFIIEPFSRDTAPAIGLAATFLLKKDRHATMVVLPADQLIKEEVKFCKLISFGVLVAQLKDCLVTVGLKPDFPATGFGYIRPGLKYKTQQGKDRFQVYKVAKFVEKPDLKKARQFIKSGYLWNSGIFIWKASCILGALKKYSPKIYKQISYIQRQQGKKNFSGYLKNAYSKMPAKSIDYAVMERSRDVYVIKSDLKWRDIGSWLALWHVYKKDKLNNVILGNFKVIDSKGSIVLSDKKHLVATVGIRDLIIIHTKDATLVCSKEKAEKVKDLVQLLEKDKKLKRFI